MMILPRQIGACTLILGILSFPAWYLTDAILAFVTPGYWQQGIRFATVIGRIMTAATITLVGIALWALSALTQRPDDSNSQAILPRTIGTVLIVGPPIYFLARCIVLMVKIGLVRSWATEGIIFTSPLFYLSMFRMLFPLVLIGLAISLWGNLRSKNKPAEQHAAHVPGARGMNSAGDEGAQFTPRSPVR
ncbi:MAG: hypothetical protein K8T26_08150 [Lentisphaerae bacterium]|nr:hypothetical protein [Lentisphaerota bacterium]